MIPQTGPAVDTDPFPGTLSSTVPADTITAPAPSLELASMATSPPESLGRLGPVAALVLLRRRQVPTAT